MGRVFSIEQVKDCAETVPVLSDFSDALANFESAAEEEIAGGAISGAIVYGSVAIGAANIRSDFDCMITPHDHTPEGRAAIGRVLQATSLDGLMEVGAILHPKPRLASGAHELDKYFGRHLTGGSRVVLGEDQANYIQFADQEGYPLLAAYIRHKKRSVSVSLSEVNPRYHIGLQRVLELPLAVGRKALQVLDDIEGTERATADSANKSKITPASLALFESLGLDEVPRELLDLNKAYTQVLEDFLQSSATEAQYADVLAEIASKGLDANVWLDLLDAQLEAKYAPIV